MIIVNTPQIHSQSATLMLCQRMNIIQSCKKYANINGQPAKVSQLCGVRAVRRACGAVVFVV